MISRMFKYTYLKNTFFLLFVYTKTPFELKMYTYFYIKYQKLVQNACKSINDGTMMGPVHLTHE